MMCKIFYGSHSQTVEDAANYWLSKERIKPRQVVVRILKFRHDNQNKPGFALYYEVDETL